MNIGVLGPLTVDDVDPKLNPRDRVVLEALVAAGRGSLSAETLADALWGEAPPASWAKNLQGCIVRLRKLLGRQAIETSEGGYLLRVPDDAVDLRRFERLVARGHELLVLREPERAAYHLTQALGLWRGRPLCGLDQWEPGLVEGRRLELLRGDAQDWWLEARLASGGHEAVLAEAEALVSAGPTRERRWQMLALAQYRSGRQADALDTLRRARTTLVEELGLDPGPELTALERDMLRQEPTLVVLPEVAEPSAASPYPGLAAFDVADAESFFGREAALATALERLQAEGVLVVAGPSGCGKSSFVRAGVAASLERRGLRVSVIVPGAHPLAALGELSAAAGSTRHTAVVVDQAEESFALCKDLDERKSFWAAVEEMSEHAPVVVAFRADRMGDVASDGSLARLVERGLFLLGAMNPDELRSAVLEPARRAGLVVESGLVDLLLREVEDEPGALPLLSHALRETWRRREARSLTVAAYREAGGVRGAVAQTAEAVYADGDADLRAAMKGLMLRLVVPVPDGDPMRTRVPRRQVVDAKTGGLVEVLVQARLLTMDTDVLTLAHEALARSWPRLRGWLEDDTEGVRILHHLSASADAWSSLGRPDSELYRGLRLSNALEWIDRTQPDLTELERDFIFASEALAERERLDAEQRERAQVRLIRRQRQALGVAVVLLVLALVAGGVALWQQQVATDRGQQARTAEVAAEASAIEALAGQAGARALALDDIDTSLLLAASAARMHESAATRGNLLDAIAKHQQLVSSTPLEGASILGLALHPHGRLVAVYDRSNRVRMLKIATREVTAEFAPPEAPRAREQVAPMAFHPDGSVLAVGLPILSERAVRLLDGRTLAPRDLDLPGLSGPGAGDRDRAISLAFSADGTTLAGTFHRVGRYRWPDGEVTLEVLSAALLAWDLTDVTDPRLVMRAPLEGRTFESFKDRDVVGLSPDGATAYTSRPLTAYDAVTGDVLWRSKHDGFVMDVSPDGHSIAVDASPDVLVIHAATGDVHRRLRGHTEDVWAVRWSPDGRYLASAADDSAGLVWDVGEARITERLDLGENNVRGLAFTRGGRQLLTGGTDQVVRAWNISGRSAYVSRVVAPGEFKFGWVLPAPDGRTTAQFVARKATFFMDAATGKKSRRVGPLNGFSDGSWTRDGATFVSVVSNRVALWTRDGRRLADNSEHRLPGRGYDIDFTGDESRLVVTQEDGKVLMLDTETLAPAGRQVDFGELVCCASGGPGDHTASVLIGGPPAPEYESFEFETSPHSWALLDLERGEVVRQGPIKEGWHAELSPDAKTVAIGRVDGSLAFIDTATGRLLRAPVKAHQTPCCYLSWSSDSSTVAGSTYDGFVSLWDGRTGGLMGRAQIPEITPVSVEFMPDDRTLTIATYTSGIYRWDTSVEAALDHACILAARNLTKDEWETFYPGEAYHRTCTPEQLAGPPGT